MVDEAGVGDCELRWWTVGRMLGEGIFGGPAWENPGKIHVSARSAGSGAFSGAILE